MEDLPSRIIVAWSGTIGSIPDGWVLCNGENNTPDLRNKFIIGASIDDLGIAKTNVAGNLSQEGGELTHTHEFTAKIETGYTINSATAFGDLGEINGETLATESIPPFFSLAFIMKL